MAESTGFGQGRARGERLVTLCAALMLGRPVTLAELRDRFELYADGDEDASRRRFERDKQDLRGLGVHVDEVAVGGAHGYRIDTHDAVSVAWSEEEALALATLAAMVDDPVTGAALAKVAVDTPDYPAESADVRVRVDLSVAPQLARASFERRRVTFTYRTAREEVSSRTVEPWAIASRRGLTYLTGWDLAREQARVYRTDRIDGPVRDAGEATAERPPAGVLGVALRPDQRRDVVMQVDPRRVGDAIAMGATVTDPEPGTTVTATFPEVRDETAIGWALRHRARVVAPDDLAAEVVRRRSRVVDRHAGAPGLHALRDAPVRRARQAGLSDERLARLLTLPAWLEARPGVTPDEVARAFGCTIGEVLGELELLDLVEVPGLGSVAEAEVDADGQIRFRSMVRTPTATLTVPEVLHLLTLVDVAATVMPTAQASMVQGIGKRLRDALPVAASGIEMEAVDQPAVAAIRQAMDEGRAIRFRYRGRHDDALAWRHVVPTHLSLRGGALYLTGRDLDAEEPRVFRLDRVSQVGRRPADVTGPDLEPVSPRYVPVGDEVVVELRLTTRGTWILALVAPSRVVDLGDGEVQARVRTDAPAWLAAHVRAAGGEAEVLRPAALRADLAAT